MAEYLPHLVVGHLDVTDRFTARQITFPATQSASTGANVLDDYEEGTWTPGLSFGGGTTGITYTARAGTYTKIGNRVLFQGDMLLSAKGSSTGSALITGLPFTSNSTASRYHAVSLALFRVTYANMAQGWVAVNGTTIVLSEVTEAGTPTDLADTDFADTSEIIVTGQYMV